MPVRRDPRLRGHLVSADADTLDLPAVPAATGVATPRLPMPAVPPAPVVPAQRTVVPAQRTVVVSPRPRTPGLTGIPARAASLVDRHLDGRLPAPVLVEHLVAITWPPLPPGVPVQPASAAVIARGWRRALTRAIAAPLAELATAVRPWQEDADAPCQRWPPCTAEDPCAHHRALVYAWHDVRDPAVLALLEDVPRLALAMLTGGARPT